MSSTAPLPLMSARAVAKGQGWRLNEYLCRAGPEDRPFEERHQSMSIALVTAGSFRYSGHHGRALLHPGALLLGNAGSCFECGHDHSTGDRCLSLHLEPEFFAEIAASMARTGDFRFASGMLPALGPLMAPATALLTGEDPERREESVIGFVEATIRALADGRASPVLPSPQDHRRIDRVLRYIEIHADRPLGLDELAGVACMSKYHFLRCFRRALGSTPYDYLLGLRLRRAALRLAATDEPVSAIAYGTGFADLSSFNRRFSQHFKEAPRRFRARSRS